MKRRSNPPPAEPYRPMTAYQRGVHDRAERRPYYCAFGHCDDRADYERGYMAPLPAVPAPRPCDHDGGTP